MKDEVKAVEKSNLRQPRFHPSSFRLHPSRRKPARSILLSIFVFSVMAAAVFVSPSSSGQGRKRLREDLGRVLGDFDALSFEPSALLARARKEGRLSLRTSRGAFELNVEPFDVRSDDYRSVAVGAGGETVELPRAPARWFRGTVEGVEGSRARFVLDENNFQGIVVTPVETYFVEPAANLSKAAARGEYVFYTASSVKPSASGVVCGTTLAERVGAEDAKRGGGASARPTLKGGVTENAFAPKPQTDIATVADFEFTQSFDGQGEPAAAANQYIQDIIAQVDGIYDAQLGIRLKVVSSRAYMSNDDPYTQTDAGAALIELRENYDASYTNAGQTPPARDLVHMFTGKDLNGSIFGISYTSVACKEPGLSYGISQSKFGGAATAMIESVALTAHEIGHNFGASHPDEEVPVPPSCGSSIMTSSIQSSSNFCQFSRDQITNYVSAYGSCLTRLVTPGCAYSFSPAAQFFPASGGAGSVEMTTDGGCDWGLAEGADWIDAGGPSASGPGAAFYTVRANTNAGPRQTSVDIAGKKLIVTQAAAPACALNPIEIGQTVSGSLDAGDCRSSQLDRPDALIDLYTFTGRAGQKVRVEMSATNGMNTFLYLFGPDGSVVAFNDDLFQGTETDSRIPFSGFFALPRTGVYTIEATTSGNGASGGYTLSLGDNSSTNSVSFNGNSFGVSETLGSGGLGVDGSGFRVFNVTRSGDASGAASVDFATSDGTAERRKDYEQTLGTLSFGPGETSKSFNVFVADDALAEGAETLSLTLSNPSGTSLGAVTSATLNINSNDAASASSPVRAESFDTSFFVRQQYLDFLSREPDAQGFAFWKNEIDSCGSAQCKEAKRINVSAAFFLSIEFQNTGYLVYRFYKAAYGDATSPGVEGTVPVIRLEDFLPDTQRIGRGVVVGVGLWEQKLEANKQEFSVEFVLRRRFMDAFPLTLTHAQFVDKLIQNSGVSFTQGEREQLVARLSASPDVAAGRAAVLRQVAEDSRLQQQERNRAFVLTQYFGYMRRNPSDAPELTLNFAGWRFWLDKLDRFGGNFVAAEMVKAFLISDEYVNRFGL